MSEPREFNSYGARRGNHEVMVRGTFANIRLRNKLLDGVEGGYTAYLPDGEQMTIFDAANRYREQGVPLIVIAGREYGSGSSRDWAAKGSFLLGVRAVIAESFERIHRSTWSRWASCRCSCFRRYQREPGADRPRDLHHRRAQAPRRRVARESRRERRGALVRGARAARLARRRQGLPRRRPVADGDDCSSGMTLISELRAALPKDAVLTEPAELRMYECDGLTGWRAIPRRWSCPAHAGGGSGGRCAPRHAVPFVARGAGTGLSGGALPVAGRRSLSAWPGCNRILEVDVPNRRGRGRARRHQPRGDRGGRRHGLDYAPDPSSQPVCTIGGNVAENAGGAHCLKYGFTTNHVLELEVVLPPAATVERLDRTGRLDLVAAFVGSEGTLGIATEAVIRLLPLPERVETLLAGSPRQRAGGSGLGDHRLGASCRARSR